VVAWTVTVAVAGASNSTVPFGMTIIRADAVSTVKNGRGTVSMSTGVPVDSRAAIRAMVSRVIISPRFR
jgi:hypothetical protein